MLKAGIVVHGIFFHLINCRFFLDILVWIQHTFPHCASLLLLPELHLRLDIFANDFCLELAVETILSIYYVYKYIMYILNQIYNM